MFSGKMLKILVLFSSCVTVFILECQAYGNSTKIVISSCDGQMVTGDILSVDYTAINSHCTCITLPRYYGTLQFASNTILENCYTEIAIFEVTQTEPCTSSIIIPCKGERKVANFKVTHDSVFYILSRSVNTTTAQERFLQDITIFGIAVSSLNASVSVTCGSTSAKPSDIITTTENGYTSTTGEKGESFLSLQVSLAIFVVISIVSTIMNMNFYIHIKLRKKCGSKTTNVQISPRSGTEATAETYTELGNTVSENQYDSLSGQDNYTQMNV